MEWEYKEGQADGVIDHERWEGTLPQISSRIPPLSIQLSRPRSRISNNFITASSSQCRVAE